MNTLLSGLVMGESPRWHDGRLWLSDMGGNEVVRADLDGKSEIVTSVPGMPMGLGWLPDGRFLVVSSRDGKLLRREPDGSWVTHADLAPLSAYPWSDMVVDGRGNAYVGNIGFDFGVGDPAPGTVALVTADGVVREVAGDFGFPNGMAVTPDNRTLIVAESYGNRLTAFDIEEDGSLANRRVWADLPGAFPDGICLDAEGAVWFAEVPGQRCVRVREGGEVLQTVGFDQGAFACVLGGPEGTTLFVTTAPWPPDGSRGGEVVTVEAPARAVGYP
ncbi:SMP-30/gluconolactonase/LRE family protein [Phytohabitans sp. LJ34]|uniref:SMP-30/gluconolactonase/LRE family protein n=1 Tax=Phytohabitans sp. LJ34 TaxID=3452217 RepID=UPI003F88D505